MLHQRNVFLDMYASAAFRIEQLTHEEQQLAHAHGGVRVDSDGSRSLEQHGS